MDLRDDVQPLVEDIPGMEGSSQCALEGEEGIPCWVENSPRDGGPGAFLLHIEATLVEDSPCLEAGTMVGDLLLLQCVSSWVEDNQRGEACTPAGCSRGGDTRGRVENRTGRDGRGEDEVSHS